MPARNPHRVSVNVQGKTVTDWKSYSISVDALQPADAFSMSMPFSRDAWRLFAPDVEVAVHIDDTRILTGYVGERAKTRGTMLEISGRDKTGRLVDESCPSFSYGGLHIRELAEVICGVGGEGALFESVVLVNTENRSLLRSKRARKANVSVEPIVDPVVGAFRAGAGLAGVKVPELGSKLEFTVPRPPIIEPGIFRGRAAPRRVQPGQTRWAVLEEFLREARLLAWSTADGRSLFIGLPNYEQEPQYLFLEDSVESESRNRTNCHIAIRESVEDMYALYVACGAARGNSVDFGDSTSKHLGEARDNPDDAAGVGVHFRRPKSMLIADDSIRNARDATERAEREQLQREAGRLQIDIDTDSHGQLYSGDTPTIYAVDTMCRVVDYDTGIDAACWLSAVDYHFDEAEGTRTAIRAVPKGTLLSL